jgi:hypothetical protein
VDVLAVSPDGTERVGVEIETGQSDVVRNVRNGLLSGYDRVIVVSCDGDATRKIERALAGAGLLVPGRVVVVVGTTLLPDPELVEKGKLPGIQ